MEQESLLYQALTGGPEYTPPNYIVYNPLLPWKLDIGSSTHKESTTSNLVVVDNNFSHLQGHTNGFRVCADVKHLPFKSGVFPEIIARCVPYCEIPDKEVPTTIQEIDRTWSGYGNLYFYTCNSFSYSQLKHLRQLYKFEHLLPDETYCTDRCNRLFNYFYDELGFDYDRSCELLDKAFEPRDSETFFSWCEFHALRRRKDYTHFNIAGGCFEQVQ